MAQTSTITLEALAPISSHREPPSNVFAPDARSVQSQQELGEQPAVDSRAELSKGRTMTIIATLTGTTVVSSFSSGLLTVGLPKMAEDLGLPGNLLLWYALQNLMAYRVRFMLTFFYEKK